MSATGAPCKSDRSRHRVVGILRLGTKHKRALNISAFQSRERLIGFDKRQYLDFSSYARKRCERKKLLAIGAGEIGYRDDLPFSP